MIDFYYVEQAKNIRRNIKTMLRLLEVGNDRDSSLIDLANHIDDIAQVIENGDKNDTLAQPTFSSTEFVQFPQTKYNYKREEQWKTNKTYKR